MEKEKSLSESIWFKRLLSKNVIILLIMTITLPMVWVADTVYDQEVYGFMATALGLFLIDGLTTIQTVAVFFLYLLPVSLVVVYLFEKTNKKVSEIIPPTISIISIVSVVLLSNILESNAPSMLMFIGFVLLITYVPNIIYLLEKIFIHILYKNSKTVFDSAIRLIGFPIVLLQKLSNSFSSGKKANLVVVVSLWLIPIILGVFISLL